MKHEYMYIYMSVIWVQVTEQTFACSFSELCDDLRVFNFIYSALVKAFFLFLLLHIFLKVGDKSVEKQGTSTYLI